MTELEIAGDHVEPFRRLADTIPHVVWITQLHPERVIYVSPSFERTWGRTAQELYDDPRVWAAAIHPQDRQRVEALFGEWITGERAPDQRFEYRIVQPSGAVRWISDHGVVTYNAQGAPVRVSGVSTDITDLKQAEREHLAHLWFLQSLDRVNQAIQGTNDLEEMMRDVLAQVLEIFDGDRAWLVFSGAADPPRRQFVVAQARPAYATGAPTSFEQGLSSDAANLLRQQSEAQDVLRLGPQGDPGVAAELARHFQVQAALYSALRAEGGARYAFSLQQCSGVRSWTGEEERLFREIGRRLADAIGTLSAVRSLRESEARLEAAQRQAHLGYWSIDLETEVVTWSDETYRIHGLVPRAVSPRVHDLSKLVHPHDRARFNQAAADAMTTGGSYVVEYRAVRPTSEIRYVHSDGHTVLDDSGRPVALFGTVQDITERKRAEQLFSAQHAVTKLLAEAATLEDAAPRMLEAICENLDWDLGALWRLDAHGQSLRCSDARHARGAATPRFLAATRERTFCFDDGLPGRVWSARHPCFVPDIALDASSPRASIAAEEGLHAAFGFPILLGSECWGVMEFFSQEIREPDQDLLATMATLGSQIGQFVERKRAETALQHARDQLAHVTRVASLGEMTASIAHEVNQPLTGIIANAHAALRWLAKDPPDLNEAIESIQRLARDGKRAGEVVGRLRTLIRQGDKTRKVSIDVNQVVRETLPLIRSEVQQNAVAIELDLAPELPSVFADRVQLQQVILNLIINALEAMATVQDRPRELRIASADQGSGGVLVTLRDTGNGLQPAHMASIFDAFFTTKAQGMGMGLAISRSIVEDHGGRLSATSELGRGSTFQFTLPKEQSA